MENMEKHWYLKVKQPEFYSEYDKQDIGVFESKAQGDSVFVVCGVWMPKRQ